MKTVGIYIDVDKEIKEIKETLGVTEARAKKVLVAALKKTATYANKQDTRITKKTYTAKQDIHQLKYKKPTTSNLEAILSDKGENVSITHFTHRVGKKRISVKINKNNGYKKIGRYGNLPFPVTSGNTNGGAFIAVRHPGKYMKNFASRYNRNHTKHTEFLEKIDSISSPVMRGNDNTWGTIKDDVYKELQNNIEKEMERILSR